MKSLINNIMLGLQSEEHILSMSDANEIVLALTCNLDDPRTLSYARVHFRQFFKSRIDSYSLVVSQIKQSQQQEQSRYLIPAKNSVIILEAAKNAYNDRMENYNHNE